MERAIKEKMTTLDVESAMPPDLINAKPLTISKDFLLHHNYLNLWIKQILYLKLLTREDFSFRTWWFD